MNDTANTPELKRCSECGQEKPATPEYYHRRTLSKDGLQGYCKECRIKKSLEWNRANPQQWNESKKRWRENNPEKARESTRQWARANPEKVRENHRQWSEENREAISERSRKYYEENREVISERQRKWREENPEYDRRYREENREAISERRRKWREENPEKARERSRKYREENPEYICKWRKANPEKARALYRAHVHTRRARKLENGGTFTDEDVQLQYKSQEGRCWWCQREVGDDYHVDHVIPLARGGSNAPKNLCISCPKCNLSKNDKLPHEFNGRLF